MASLQNLQVTCLSSFPARRPQLLVGDSKGVLRLFDLAPNIPSQGKLLWTAELAAFPIAHVEVAEPHPEAPTGNPLFLLVVFGNGLANLYDASDACETGSVGFITQLEKELTED